MNADATASDAFRRDRRIILAALVAVSAIAWFYLYNMAVQTEPHVHHAMPAIAWNANELILAFLMWNVMMIGMMIPTASPMILTFSVTSRRYRGNSPVVPTFYFVLGYLLVWAGYSAFATLAEWGLNSVALLTPVTLRATPTVGASLLIIAGVFQWSAVKYNCLTQCRSPLSFLLTEWREGGRGALQMGMKHGGYCVGCCWAVMALMLVAGAMNLLWTAALTIYMLLEKIVPGGHDVGRAVGVLFVVAGMWMLSQAALQ